MTQYAAFCLSFGALLCAMAIMAAWMFRSSGAPLLAQTAIPILIVIVAIATPYQVAAMMGFPTSVQPPDHAELIAYVPHDEEGRVDLWLRVGQVPRAYEVPLDDKLKKTLRDAQERQGAGQRVMIRKRKAPRGVQTEISPPPSFEIDDSAFALPNKEP